MRSLCCQVKRETAQQDAKFRWSLSRLPRPNLNSFTFVIFVIFCAILLRSRSEQTRIPDTGIKYALGQTPKWYFLIRTRFHSPSNEHPF